MTARVSLRPSRPRRGAGGFTLVEIMVIVVILALTSVITGPSLLRALAGDPLLQAGSQLRVAWRQARAAAEGRGGILEWSAGRLRFIPTRGPAQEFIIDERVQVAWQGTVPAGPAKRLVVDQQGRCLDVRLGLSHRGRTAQLQLSGLSGSVRVLGPGIQAP